MRILKKSKNMQSAKYHSTKVHDVKHGDFDSKKEYRRYLELYNMESIGMIKDLKRQVSFMLLPKQELKNPRPAEKGNRMQHYELPVKYVADFTYFMDGHLVVEDAKGMRTDVYKLKRKLMLYIHGIEIKEV